MAPGTLFFGIGIGILFAVGCGLIGTGVQRFGQRGRRPSVSAADFPLHGNYSGPFADFAAMLHETGTLTDRQFEAVLAEIRDIQHQRVGNYAEQQLASIQGLPPVVGETDFLGRPL